MDTLAKCSVGQGREAPEGAGAGEGTVFQMATEVRMDGDAKRARSLVLESLRRWVLHISFSGAQLLLTVCESFRCGKLPMPVARRGGGIGVCQFLPVGLQSFDHTAI